MTYHSRTLGGSAPIIPFGHVTRGIMINLELLIGPFENGEDNSYEGRGFVASIFNNMKGDRGLVRERLEEERVAQMLRAAVEAMVDCRGRARKMTEFDAWALKRLRWVAGWIKKLRAWRSRRRKMYTRLVWNTRGWLLQPNLLPAHSPARYAPHLTQQLLVVAGRRLCCRPWYVPEITYDFPKWCEQYLVTIRARTCG